MPPINHSPVSIPAGSYDSAALAKAFEKAASETDHAARSAILNESLGIAVEKPAPAAEASKADPVAEVAKPAEEAAAKKK